MFPKKETRSIKNKTKHCFILVPSERGAAEYSVLQIALDFFFKKGAWIILQNYIEPSFLSSKQQLNKQKEAFYNQ